MIVTGPLPRRRAWYKKGSTMMQVPKKLSPVAIEEIKKAFLGMKSGNIIMNSSEENKPSIQRIEPYVQVVSPIRVFGRPTSTIRKSL